LRLLLPLKRLFPQRKLTRLQEVGLNDILSTVIIISLFAFCCWLIHQYFEQTRFPGRLLNIKWVKITAGMLLCVGLSHLFEFSQQYLLNTLLSFEDQPRRLFFLNLRGFVIGGFQLFMVYYIAAIKEAEHAKIEIEQLKKENLQARLNLLKQQVSPHFLFNSLSTLKTIAPDHHTRQYIMQLSNVYRYLLNYNDTNMATLKDELAFTNSYLYILQERYEQALQIQIRVPDALLSLNIPPLSLQILVENAIKHNVISSADPLTIQIHSEGNDLLTVENTYQPKLSTEKHTGKGLQNINDRYQLLSGRQIEIIQTDTTFIVKLPLLS